MLNMKLWKFRGYIDARYCEPYKRSPGTYIDYQNKPCSPDWEEYWEGWRLGIKDRINAIEEVLYAISNLCHKQC